MRSLLVVATCLGLVVVQGTSARAGEGLDNLKWCETETGGPAQEKCRVQNMPDGKVRGTRSAATLIAVEKRSQDARNPVHPRSLQPFDLNG
jgi:hypothetical protein